jgi:hypothetical protein
LPKKEKSDFKKIAEFMLGYCTVTSQKKCTLFEIPIFLIFLLLNITSIINYSRHRDNKKKYLMIWCKPPEMYPNTVSHGKCKEYFFCGAIKNLTIAFDSK